jgi:serine/threonine protein kinase/class 3 adenylate cyclase
MHTIGQRYELDSEIGRGTSGSVWVARDLLLGRRVAVKLLHPDLLDSLPAVARFKREAWTIAQLRSRNIVQVFDAGVDDGNPFIVMELLEGESLDARTRRVGSLPLPLVLRIVTDVVKALSLTHRTGVVHRDVKPANIFLAREPNGETAKLLDFGIATARSSLGATADTAVSPVMAGTPHYMAPEQLSGTEPDAKSDLWSLAVLTYQLLTGRFPFEGSTLFLQRDQIIAGRFTSPSSIVHSLNENVDGFFSRTFQFDPGRRFASADEFLTAFSALVDPSLAPATKILLLDDEIDMQLLVEQRFRREIQAGRYSFIFALNGRVGLEELSRQPDIDVILSDINMPEMDGLSFLARVPDLDPCVRVVMITAYSDMANIRLAMNRGAFDFICKPLDFDDLKVTITKCAEETARSRRAHRDREENRIMRSLLGPTTAERVLPAMRGRDSVPLDKCRACVAFISVLGFQEARGRLPPESVFSYVDSHFQVFLLELMAHTATEVRLVQGCVMAIFGGEGHATRALEACLSVIERLSTLEPWTGKNDELRHSAAIGIDVGEVVSGGVGALSLGRLEQMFIGEPVVSAARFLELGQDGDVLISERLATELLGRYLLEPVGPESTAGACSSVFRVLGRRAVSGVQTLDIESDRTEQLRSLGR